MKEVMSKNKRQQLVIERIQEFFDQIFALKSSDTMRQYLEFCARMPNHSTFNSTLVFIQKPSCFYYATKTQWEKRFNRKPKPFARPLLILFPFAPVEFVYDLEDIDGEPLAEKDLTHWWIEEKGGISKEKFENLIKLCEELHIKTSIAPSDYLHKEGHKTFGIAYRKLDDNKRGIELHPRYNDPKELAKDITSFGWGYKGRVKIKSTSDVVDVFNLIKQSYEQTL